MLANGLLAVYVSHYSDELVRISDRLVVMSEHGATLLRQVHGVRDEVIDRIPHGIPEVPFTGDAKDRLGFGGEALLLTFGLLSPDKGIEQVIDALPAILAVHPEAVYAVVGATHPRALRRPTSISLRGVPSGLLGSVRIAPS